MTVDNVNHKKIFFLGLKPFDLHHYNNIWYQNHKVFSSGCAEKIVKAKPPTFLKHWDFLVMHVINAYVWSLYMPTEIYDYLRCVYTSQNIWITWEVNK